MRSLDPIRSLPLLRLLLTVIQPGSCWDPHGSKIENKYIAKISIDRPFPFSALSRQTNYVYPTRLPFFFLLSLFSLSASALGTPPRLRPSSLPPPWSNTCVAAHHNRALPTSITRAFGRRMTGRFKDRNHVELRD